MRNSSYSVAYIFCCMLWRGRREEHIGLSMVAGKNVSVERMENGGIIWIKMMLLRPYFTREKEQERHLLMVSFFNYPFKHCNCADDDGLKGHFRNYQTFGSSFFYTLATPSHALQCFWHKRDPSISIHEHDQVGVAREQQGRVKTPLLWQGFFAGYVTLLHTTR